MEEAGSHIWGDGDLPSSHCCIARDDPSRDLDMVATEDPCLSLSQPFSLSPGIDRK